MQAALYNLCLSIIADCMPPAMTPAPSDYISDNLYYSLV